MSSAKRQLAAELGIDPYTDFKPLADKLDETATTMALGGLAPKAVFTAIGGDWDCALLLDQRGRNAGAHSGQNAGTAGRIEPSALEADRR